LYRDALQDYLLKALNKSEYPQDILNSRY